MRVIGMSSKMAKPLWDALRRQKRRWPQVKYTRTLDIGPSRTTWVCCGVRAMLMMVLQSYAGDWDEQQDGKTTVGRAPQAKAQVASGQVHPHTRYWSLAHYLGMLRSARDAYDGAAILCG